MIARNIETRIVKLEARRRRPDELLLVWRRPGVTVTEALAGARFAAGDRVICAEWLGKAPIPGPRWFGKRLSSEIGAVEYGYILRALDRLVDAKPPSREPSLPATGPSTFLGGASDSDLLHMALGVET
jgi:hypothetical protein